MLHTWTIFADSSVIPDRDEQIEQFVFVIATDRRIGSRVCRKLIEAEPNLRGVEPAQGRPLQVSSAVADELWHTMRAGSVVSRGNTEGRVIPSTATSNLGSVMLSKRLRTLRLQENVSLFELAQKSGVQLQVLVDCEKEGREPDPIMFPRLAMALGVRPNDLFSP